MQIEKLDDRILMANDVYTVIANTTSLQSSVLDNDTAEVATLFTDAKHGAVEMNADGTFEYTPLLDWTGVDGFMYESGGDLWSVRVNVIPFVLQPDDPADNPHSGQMAAEHEALLLEVAPRIEADTVAYLSGNWSDPSIWSQGLPQTGDKVLVYGGVQVNLDVDTPRMDWLRIDGEFHSHTGATVYANDVVGSPSSVVRVTAGEFVVTPGPVDDSQALSRGVIFHGDTEITGELKTSKAIMADAVAGATSVTLQSVPADWVVGDQILITGVSGDTEEFRTIAAINGSVVSLDSALQFNHVRPVGDTYDAATELNIYVGNVTRSVIFRSEDPLQRGHFMIMHKPTARIENAAFIDLGRTDKTQLIDDPAANLEFPGTGTNPRGRYGLHLHRLGTSSSPVTVSGNVVLGSPGWGLVQHDSAANIVNNVVYGAIGAGIVAETGNEIGLWHGNLVVKSDAHDLDALDDNTLISSGRNDQFDMGFGGTGYWVQGGGFGIQLTDNVASNVMVGLDLFGRIDFGPTLRWTSVSKIPDADVRAVYENAGWTSVLTSELPTRGIDGLEVYNARRGIHTWMMFRNEDRVGGTQYGLVPPHYSQISNATLWNVKTGIQHFYSTRFQHDNVLIVGNPSSPIAYWPGGDTQANGTVGAGVTGNSQAGQIDFNNLRIEGFEYGLQVYLAEPSDSRWSVVPGGQSRVNGYEFSNVDYAFTSNASSNGFMAESFEFSKLFELSGVSGLADVSGPLPVASGTASVASGIVSVDGSASVSNVQIPHVTGIQIVAYVWQHGGNTYYGRTAEFPHVAGQDVTLTVYDPIGQSSQVVISL